MHPNNSKVVGTIATNLADTRPSSGAADLNRNNFILLRKSSDVGHILLRTQSKNNLLLEDPDSSKFGQILIQQSDIKKSVFVQSVKRLRSPILLLSGGDSNNDHILIQANPDDIRSSAKVVMKVEESSENILVRALEGIRDTDAGSSRGTTTSLGAGKFYQDVNEYTF